MREHDHDNARYRDHDIVFIEASIILAIALAIVLAMIGKRQRGRRSKRPDYKLESGQVRNARCTQVQDSWREVHECSSPLNLGNSRTKFQFAASNRC